MRILIACVIGFLLDSMFGDPVWLYHPVRLVGKLIETLEKGLRRIAGDSDKGLLVAGGVLCVIVSGVSAGIPFGILLLA